MEINIDSVMVMRYLAEPRAVLWMSEKHSVKVNHFFSLMEHLKLHGSFQMLKAGKWESYNIQCSLF